jgi:hypothetical protein
MTETFVYFVMGEETTKKFINLDMTKNKIMYADLPILDPKIKVIPILGVKKQDFF